MSEIKGTRLKDTVENKIPKDIKPGDYWKILTEGGEPLEYNAPHKLTKSCWRVVVPLGKHYGIGKLILHTVREHKDGTISVRRNDGSSNSILVSDNENSWHGYIEHGVFKKV